MRRTVFQHIRDPAQTYSPGRTYCRETLEHRNLDRDSAEVAEFERCSRNRRTDRRGSCTQNRTHYRSLSVSNYEACKSAPQTAAPRGCCPGKHDAACKRVPQSLGGITSRSLHRNTLKIHRSHCAMYGECDHFFF